MRILLRVFIILMGLSSAVSGMAMARVPEVEVRATAIDEKSKPLEGVLIDYLYPAARSSLDEWASKHSDINGKVVVRGRSHFPVRVHASQEGYYKTSLKIKTHEGKNPKRIYSDQDVKLVLRKIKNPIPMYAYEFDAVLSIVSNKVGFDVLKRDWIAPHGEGEVADFVFEVSGYYHDSKDYDSSLELSFANPGDGVVQVETQDSSQFRSPYEAPQSGYADRKVWRKWRRAIPGERYDADIHNDSHAKGDYAFRIRSVVDEDGHVKEALYGKIYGNIKFGGATSKGSYVGGFNLYVNPAPNDRNLEFDPAKNLATNVPSSKHPNAP